MMSIPRFLRMFKKPTSARRATLVMAGIGDQDNHKREVVIGAEMDIKSLKMVSIGLFRGASLTSHLVDKEFIENVSQMIHLYRDDEERGKVKINNIEEIMNGDEVTVSFQGSNTMKRIHEIVAEEKRFKLWCAVHSIGQGYIKAMNQGEYLHFVSSGTIENAEAFELHFADQQLPGKVYYRLCVHHGDAIYYFCHGNDGTLFARPDIETSILFEILQCEEDIRHSVFMFKIGDEMKMLIVGSNDILTSKNVNERIGAGRFMDPASYFSIAVI